MTQANRWSQLPGEPKQAYQKFLIYLGLDIEERSVAKALEVWQANELEGKDDNIMSWSRLAGRFQWQDRSQAYDQSEEKKVKEKLEHAKDLRKLAKERNELSQKVVLTAYKILEKTLIKIEDLDPKEIKIEHLPSLLKTAATLADIGLTTKADSLCVLDVIQAMGLDKLTSKR